MRITGRQHVYTHENTIYGVYTDELIVIHILQTIYRVILLWRNSTCWVSHAGVQGVHCRHGESDTVDRVRRRFEVGHAGCGT